MKKLLVGLVLVFGVSQKNWASSVGQFVDIAVQDVRANSHWGDLAAINPGYFGNLQDGKAQGIADHNAYWYRWFSVDVGLTGEIDKSARGDILIGSSFHIKNFIGDVFPSFSYHARANSIPYWALAFWDKAFIGYAAGWGFNDGHFVHGPKAGLRFLFG